MPDALLGPDVVVGQDRVLLLILPSQVSDVPGGDGDGVVCAGEAGDDGHRCTEEDVAVAGHDAASHCGDKDVDAAGQELLAALFRRGERSNRRGEGVFEVESLVHGLVDAIFGFDGLRVQVQAGRPDGSGETIRRRGRSTGKGSDRVGRCGSGLRSGCGWEDRGRVDLFGSGLRRARVVDGLAVLLEAGVRCCRVCVGVVQA